MVGVLKTRITNIFCVRFGLQIQTSGFNSYSFVIYYPKTYSLISFILLLLPDRLMMYMPFGKSLNSISESFSV